jgi:hypothetical protein
MLFPLRSKSKYIKNSKNIKSRKKSQLLKPFSNEPPGIAIIYEAIRITG